MGEPAKVCFPAPARREQGVDELIGLSDTIHVLFEGELVAELNPADVTPEILGSHMTGAKTGAES